MGGEAVWPLQAEFNEPLNITKSKISHCFKVHLTIITVYVKWVRNMSSYLSELLSESTHNILYI